MRLFIIVLSFLLALPSNAFIKKKSAYEKELQEREKIRLKREKELSERPANKSLNQSLTLEGKVGLEEERNESTTIKFEENDERDQQPKEKKIQI
jgi:preprotein translocase subunit SecF